MEKFDLMQIISADTKVFAGFMENVEDTRTFAIVGSGKARFCLHLAGGRQLKTHII